MESAVLHYSLLLVVLFTYLSMVEGKKDLLLYCGACKALVSELEYDISKLDPKKTIQVGSFRLNPDGTQTRKEIPLARSETHLTELLENVCTKMSDYSLYVDPETQEKNYIRFAPRDNEQMGSFDFNNFQFNPENSEHMKHACESIVEEYEDEIISLFAQEADHVADKLCIEKSDLCARIPSSHSEL
ncbi:protein canopy homolog 1 [Protopterus annectens]|uniref:protein canopy homolog 1 n=1 Tax=Protopterus annectens TaxID=7888 RepID=UPI001CFA0CE2|nr:protein canopy homolog 1 [Protopterus annectens]XP_043920718.1 protein canopy homolog 1 [Protopterus annectens]